MVGQTSQLWHAMCFASELALRIVAAVAAARFIINVVAAVAAVRKKVVAAVAASGRGFCDGADRTHWSAAHPENAIDKLISTTSIRTSTRTCLGPLLLLVLVCLSVVINYSSSFSY